MFFNMAVLIFFTIIVVTKSNIDVTFLESYLETLPYMVTKHGYVVNEYNSTTEDGYIIRIHQMRSKQGVTRDLPIILVHGIMGCSEDFLRMGPKKSLAYLLADDGYDVWLGNLRGNLYTSHVKLAKNDNAFWNFSFDEHGKYDVPAMIEKVLEVTNSSKLHYVGFSMGGTSYCVACNERPDVMKHVATFTGLAPIIFLGQYIKLIVEVSLNFGIVDFLKAIQINTLLYNDSLQRLTLSTICREGTTIGKLCYQLARLLFGEDSVQVQRERILTVLKKFEPASVKQIVHYCQLSLTGSLSKFDFGTQGNLNAYGQTKPPKYVLSANKAPTAMYYGLSDYFTLGVNFLSTNIRSMFQTGLLKFLDKFSHLDFLYSEDITTSFNYEIIKTISALYNDSNRIN